MENEIKLINNIVLQAIEHGADIGGSYDSNEKNLIIALNNWINYHNLSSKYIAKTVEVKDYWNDAPQIVKIN